MHLSDCFLELFTYIRYLCDSPELADVDYATVRTDVSLLIQRLEKRARKYGATAEQYDMARFAVFAWADESILCSSWGHSREWLKEPLQRRYYHTANAGEEFFERLGQLLSSDKAARTNFIFDDLPPEGSEMDDADVRDEAKKRKQAEQRTAEVLEVYTLCLALGFTGMYFNETDIEKLARLRRQCIRRIIGKKGIFPMAYTPDLGPDRPGRDSSGFGRVFDPISIIFLILPLLVVGGLYLAYKRLLDYSLLLWFG